jgi:hypothetical protein
MATIATRNSGYIALRGPSIMTTKASDQNQVIATITLAFSSDPAGRYLYPDPHNSLPISQNLCASSAEKPSNTIQHTMLTGSRARPFGTHPGCILMKMH